MLPDEVIRLCPHPLIMYRLHVSSKLKPDIKYRVACVWSALADAERKTDRQRERLTHTQ